MVNLVVPENVDRYNKHYREGYDKKYPTLEVVRLEIWYFKKQLGTVLDYGCGTGANMLHLLERGYKVIGVDAATESIKLVTSKLESRPLLRERAALHLIGRDDERLPCDDDSCDYVICLSVLSLLQTRERIARLLREFRRVLKPGGKMIVDINGPDGSFAQKGRFVGDDTFEYFINKADEVPARFYCPKTKEAFVQLLEGFVIDDVGHASFEYMGQASMEFLACAHKA
jgi:SAM-dependent methyltransferase